MKMPKKFKEELEQAIDEFEQTQVDADNAENQLEELFKEAKKKKYQLPKDIKDEYEFLT